MAEKNLQFTRRELRRQWHIYRKETKRKIKYSEYIVLIKFALLQAAKNDIEKITEEKKNG